MTEFRSFRAQSVVLRHKDWGEADRLLTLYTRERGKVRALAVTTAKRWSLLPETPTIAESGFAGFDVTSSGMVIAPAGTPREIVLAISTAIAKAIASPDVRERFVAQGYDAASSTPEELGKVMADESAKYARLVQLLGIKVE
mgnify:CR=1 FL=1